MLTSPQNFPAPQMSSSPADQPPARIAENLLQIRRRIETAALRHGRDASSVNLLAVTKQQAAETVRMAAAAGQREFGESYVQEALPKMEELADLDVVWHFIGQLQSNKTRTVAEHFAWVHTVDRLKIAERLSEQRPVGTPPLNICIQVKVADETGKGGMPLPEVVSAARSIALLPRVRLRGLMCIPPPPESFDKQLSYFREIASLANRLRDDGIDMDTLSMGMSDDLEAAIAAGATIVRVGTAIFGERAK